MFTTTPTRIRHQTSSIISNGTSSPGKLNGYNLQQAGLVKYVISADFDNKIGAVVRHQIPKRIPGFKENLTHLGELMIPNHSEHYKKEDYSVFILYKNHATGKYQLIPDEMDDEIVIGETNVDFQHMNLNQINTIFEQKSHDDDILFFYTVTKKIQDSNDERGGKVRSVSIGTPLRNFVIFKHHLTVTVQNYILDNKLSHLLALFNTLNSIDSTLYNTFFEKNKDLQRILSLNIPDINSHLILPKIKDIITSQDYDDVVEGIRYKSGSLQQYANISNMDIDSSNQILSKIPLNLSLSSSSNSSFQTDLNLISQILDFFQKLSQSLNITTYRNFNIMIHSQRNTDQLCQFILALSNFFNGLDSAYFHNDKILYYPLIDLYNLEGLIEYDSKIHNMKIVGTNNIIMKDDTKFYDFWYDLSTGVLTPNVTKVEFFSKSIDKTQDFLDLTAALQAGHHDYHTSLITNQRFNIYEICKILKRDDTNSNNAELNLRDYYLKRNKNLVLFDWLFEFKVIRLIDALDQLFQIVMKDTPTVDYSTLISSYTQMIEFLQGNISGHLEKFFQLIELFPLGIRSSDEMGKLIYSGVQDSDEFHNGFNYLFKPVLFRNEEVCKKIVRLYKILKNCELSLVLGKRLNVFLIIALEEQTMLA